MALSPFRARSFAPEQRLDGPSGPPELPRSRPPLSTAWDSPATGSANTTTCPAWSAPRRRCSSAIWRTSPEHLRLGSGGIMLPNHAPLRIAEAFRTLEALHPGRIDLGLGRAPGSDGRAAMALRRAKSGGGDDFPELLDELARFRRPDPLRGGPPVADRPRPARRRAAAARLAARQAATTARASPPRWDSATPSPTTSARTGSCPPPAPTARGFAQRRDGSPVRT